MLASIQATPSSSRPRTVRFSRCLAVVVSLGLLLLAWVPTTAAQQFQDGQTVEIVFDNFPGQDCGTSPEVKTIDTSPGAVEIPTGECFGLSVNVTSDAIVLSGQDNFTSGGSPATITFKQGSASSAPNISGFESPSYQRTSGVEKNPTVSSFTSTEVSVSDWSWQQSSGSDPDGNPEVATFTLATPNTAPTFTAGASTSLTVDEDDPATSISSQLEVDDPDGGQTLEWTVSSGPSNGPLAGFPATESGGTGVQPSGVTYEPNIDFSGSDAFDVEVSDGNGGSATITVNVTVNNLSPVFNSSNTTSFAENGTGTVLDVNADDGGDGSNDSGVDYSITGGTDSGALSINTSTGELSFDSAPDFETPTDSDGQNDYVVDVTADDGASSNNTTTQTITVNVTDVNEPPTAALVATSGSIDENNSPPTVLTTITINDDALGTNTLSLSGADAGAFNVNGSDELEFTATADHESKSSYDVTVEVDDSNVGADPDDSENFSLSITDVNEPPTVTANSGLSLSEGATAVLGTGVLSASDEDAGDGASALTFNVTSAVSNGTLFVDGSGTGTDDGTLDGESGIGTGSFTQATIENGNLLYAHDGSETTADGFTFDLTDDDGSGPTGETFSVSVTAQNDAPTIASLSDQTIAEDATLGPISFTVDDAETARSTLALSGSSDNTALVPDDSITFSGPDASGNASLTVDPTQDADGSAEVTVTVTDGDNATAGATFALTVQDDETVTLAGQDGTGNDTGWRLLAPPAGATRGDLDDDVTVQTGSGDETVFRWGSGQWTALGSDADALPRGVGFILYVFDDDQEEITSAGLDLDVPPGPQNTDVDATGLDKADRFEVLGNPYDVSYDLGGLAGGDLPGAGFQNTVQVWDSDAKAFQTLTQNDLSQAGDRIPAWNGFIVERTTTGSGQETLTFSTIGKQSGSGTLFGAEPPSVVAKAAGAGHAEVGLRLSVTGSAGDTVGTDRGTLWLDDRASAGWDGYEATYFPPPASERHVGATFPIARDGALTHRTLAARPYPTGSPVEVRVPLSVRGIGVGGTATIAAPPSLRAGVPDAWALGLVDTAADTTVDLRTSSYTFALEQGGSIASPSEARFRLRLTTDPLPVELTRFEGTASADGVVLRWKTASEQNNAGFRVERRAAGADESNWTVVGRREGGGTTEQPRTYQFADADLPYAADTLRYRLRQVDTDGGTSLTDPVTVVRSGPEQLQLMGTMPNPARRQATVRYALPEGSDEATLRLYDVLGRRVRTVDTEGKAGRYERTLNLGGLSSGVYVLRLSTNGQATTRKLTVVR
jgi:hypothetical protein